MIAFLSPSRLAARWDATRAVTLGLVGGYVDTVGYIMLRGLFPNHVTGKLPIAAAAAGRIGRRNPSSVLPVIFAVEAALLGLFLVLGVALVPDRDASTLVTQAIVGAVGVCAMGVQSVAARVGGYVFPTTMVTGTLTLLGMDSAQVLFGAPPSAERAVVVRRVRAFGRVVLAFAVGAAFGGLMTAVVQFRATVLPVAAVALCAWGQARIDSPQHSHDLRPVSSRRRPSQRGRLRHRRSDPRMRPAPAVLARFPDRGTGRGPVPVRQRSRRRGQRCDQSA